MILNIHQGRVYHFPPVVNSVFPGKLTVVCVKCGSHKLRYIHQMPIPSDEPDKNFDQVCLSCGGKEMTLQFRKTGIIYIFREEKMGNDWISC